MTRRTEAIFRVEHVGFHIIDCPEHGRQFALFTGLDEQPTRKNTLFTGFVHPGMAADLRRLADHIETMEAGNARDDQRPDR